MNFTAIVFSILALSSLALGQGNSGLQGDEGINPEYVTSHKPIGRIVLADVPESGSPFHTPFNELRLYATCSAGAKVDPETGLCNLFKVVLDAYNNGIIEQTEVLEEIWYSPEFVDTWKYEATQKRKGQFTVRDTFDIAGDAAYYTVDFLCPRIECFWAWRFITFYPGAAVGGVALITAGAYNVADELVIEEVSSFLLRRNINKLMDPKKYGKTNKVRYKRFVDLIQSFGFATVEYDGKENADQSRQD